MASYSYSLKRPCVFVVSCCGITSDPFEHSYLEKVAISPESPKIRQVFFDL